MNESSTVCPKCKQSELFDITGLDGCEGEVYELHCPQCDAYFDPREQEALKE